MIGWLQGHIGEPWQQANRCGVLLICHGVGYEVQLSSRHWQGLPPPGVELVLHVHHSIREEGSVLYGFRSRAERDLFRELVAVSGVGPQMALGLIGTLDLPELVQAIVAADLRSLSRAPGVGRRTAERLAVELRKRLQERFPALADGAAMEESVGADPGAVSPSPGLAEEVRLTLAALGYESLEIHRALRRVGRQDLAQAGAEEWIRACLRCLTEHAA
jgi:Holliday junction DNA helicase RuvA